MNEKERNILINEIVSFGFKYKVFKNTISAAELKKLMIIGLEDFEFIENLINTIIVKTRNQEDLDVERTKNLLLSLEKIRLDLEYSKKC